MAPFLPYVKCLRIYALCNWIGKTEPTRDKEKGGEKNQSMIKTKVRNKSFEKKITNRGITSAGEWD